MLVRIQMEDAMVYRFCPNCGNALERKEEGRTVRPFCSGCCETFYRNPTVGVAVMLVEKAKILLVKRSGSYRGKWCIPCGHVEWGEDVREAAAREFFEETGIDVTVGRVFEVHSNFHDTEKQTVGVWFWGCRKGGRLIPGPEVSDVTFFGLDSLPDLAFPTDVKVCKELMEYFEARADRC